MPRVVHFEIPPDDPENVAKFYSEIFGWKIEKWEGPVEYWLVTSGDDDEPGINGAIMRRDELQPNISNTIEVNSMDDTLNKIAAGGGTVLAPKMAVPGVGYAAYFQDTDGNRLGLMQPDTSAG